MLVTSSSRLTHIGKFVKATSNSLSDVFSMIGQKPKIEKLMGRSKITKHALKQRRGSNNSQ